MIYVLYGQPASGKTVASGSWTYTGDLVPVIVSYNGTDFTHITADFGQDGYSPSDRSYKKLGRAVSPQKMNIFIPKEYLLHFITSIRKN